MDLSTVLQLITTAAVVVGVVFGLLQVRQALGARRDYAAVDVVRSVQAQEVQDAVDTILRLPKDVDPEVRYHNLKANPEATVEIGTETIAVTARVAEPEERDRIWGKWKQAHAHFADYETKTSRQIPVVILDLR